MPSVFILTSYIPLEAHAPSSEDAHEYELGEDGSVKLYAERVGCFSSIESAESTISKLVESKKDENEKWNGWIPYACFIIEELYLDNPLDKYGYPSHYESRRSYLGDGTLCYSSYTDYRCEKKYNGGEDVGRFIKNGDFAFWLAKDELVPLYISEIAFSKEEWSKRFRPGVCGDDSDDSCLAFKSVGVHCHPAWVTVFPLSIVENYKLPNSLKAVVENTSKS